MSGVSATLELDISAAESAIDDLDAKLESVTQGFGQSLADAVSSVSGPPVEIMAEVTTDTAQVEAELASLDAPPIDVAVDADTAQVEAELASLPEPPPITVEVSESGADEAASAIGGIGDAAAGVQGEVGALTQAVGAGGLAAALGAAVGAFGEAQGAIAVTGQIIDNLGSSATISISGVQELATRIQQYSGYSDEAIIAGAGLVASFQNVANAAGEGNDIFDRTIELSADLARRMGTDVTSAAAQLGRALTAPERGLARLERQIGRFPESTRNMIISLAESGDLLGAQALLLDEVEARVGGVAAAYGETLPGQVDRASEAFGEFAETVGGAVAPVLTPIVGDVASVLEAFQRLPAGIQTAVGAFVAFTLAAGAAVFAYTALTTAFASSTAIAAGVAALGPAAPVILAIGAAATIAALAFGGLSQAEIEAAALAEVTALSMETFGASFQATGSVVDATAATISEVRGTLDGLNEGLAFSGTSAAELAVVFAGAVPGSAAYGEALEGIAVAASTAGAELSTGEIEQALIDQGIALQSAAEQQVLAAEASGMLTDAQVLAAYQANTTTDGFTNWLAVLAQLPPSAVRSAEALQQIAEVSLDNLPSIGDAISNVTEAFGGLAVATNPQAVVDNLFQMVQAFVDFTANIEAIRQISPIVAEALAPLGPEIAGAFAQGLAAAPPAVTEQLELVLLAADQAGLDLTEVLLGHSTAAGEAVPEGIRGAVPAAGEAGNKVGTAVKDGVKTGLDGMDIIAGFGARTAAEKIAEQKESARAAGWEFGWGASEGTGEGTAGMGPATQAGVNAAVNAMRGGAGFAFAGGQVLGTLFTTGTVAGIAAGTGAVQSSGGNTAAALLRGGVGPALTGGMSVGRLFSTGASVGVAAGGGGVSQSAGSVVQGAVARASEVAKSGGYGVGQALGSGIAQGIGSQISSIVSAAVNAVQQAVAAARNAAEVGSPSRLFAREVGAPMGEGIAMGLLSAESSVVAAAERITRAAAVGAVSAVAVGSGGSGSVVSIVQNIDARGADPAAVGAAAAAGAESALARHRRTVDVRLAQR